MKRILFVDDDANVLQGLQRMLRSLRYEWQMEFAASGSRALEILGNECYDVIVSDMRMPGMTGAELLTEVSRRYPHMVRIILSGQSDKENILRSVGPTHQFLSKPCEAETLKHIIARACSLRALLSSDPLQNLLSRIQALPSLPSLYTAIVDAINGPNSSAQEIGAIIARDVAMTAKILQVVNSAFFGLQRRVTDPVQAVQVLGVDTIRALVLSSALFFQFQITGSCAFSIDALWHHSMLVGMLAKQIAKMNGLDNLNIGEAYSAGLLHDVGKLAIAANLPKEYALTLQTAASRAITLEEAERETLGAGHTEVGAYLMGLWGLPDSIVEAIAFHHVPSDSMSDTFAALTAVHIADVFAHEIQHESQGDHNESRSSSLDLDYLDRLELSARIPQWRDACLQTYRGDGK